MFDDTKYNHKCKTITSTMSNESSQYQPVQAAQKGTTYPPAIDDDTTNQQNTGTGGAFDAGAETPQNPGRIPGCSSYRINEYDDVRIGTVRA